MCSAPCYYSQRNCHRQEPVDSLIQDLAETFLGLRGLHPLFHTLQRNTENEKNWSRKLRPRGFEPSDIKVSVIDDRKVKVHARRIRELENGDSDTYESIRFIEIPKDVDVDKLSSRLNEHNVLVIEGPYKGKQIPVFVEKMSESPIDQVVTKKRTLESDASDKEDVTTTNVIQSADFSTSNNDVLEAHEPFQLQKTHQEHDSAPCYYRQRNCHRQEPVDSLIQDLAETFLGLRGLHPLFRTLQRNTENEKNWSRKLRLRGFEPSDIKVSVIDDRKVKVHARRIRDLENGDSDTYESVRFIEIPKDVDVDKLSSRLNEHNVLVIEGPFKRQNIPVTAEKPSPDNDPVTQETKTEFNEPTKDDSKKDHVCSQTQDDTISVDTDFDGNVSQRTDQERDLDDTNRKDQEYDTKFPDSEIDEKEFEVLQNGMTDREDQETATLFLLTDSVDTENSIGSNDVINTENKNDDNEFKLHLDLGQFSSEDINVVRKDSSLIVTAKKEDNRDGVPVSEQYVSEYSLPDDVDSDQLSCVKTSDGKFVVSGPFKSRD